MSALEKKLEQLKAAHEDKVADLRRQVTKIGAQVSDKTAEMESLQGQIEQLEVCACACMHMHTHAYT